MKTGLLKIRNHLSKHLDINLCILKQVILLFISALELITPPLLSFFSSTVLPHYDSESIQVTIAYRYNTRNVKTKFQ